MNDQERITQLEAMLTEERDEVSHVLTILESYARGVDMIAGITYSETPAGSRDEKNAMAMKQHTTAMLGWLEAKAAALRGLMGRAMTAGQVEASSPPGGEDDMSALLFIREDGLADPSVPAENIDQSQAVTIH